jgi:hypothetical protein
MRTLVMRHPRAACRRPNLRGAAACLALALAASVAPCIAVAWARVAPVPTALLSFTVNCPGTVAGAKWKTATAFGDRYGVEVTKYSCTKADAWVKKLSYTKVSTTPMVQKISGGPKKWTCMGSRGLTGTATSGLCSVSNAMICSALGCTPKNLKVANFWWFPAYH